MALAFHSEYVPLGSGGTAAARPRGEAADERREPKGRTPPLCVYFCWTPPTYPVMYSTDAESSRVRRWDCASRRALLIKMRASAVRPRTRRRCGRRSSGSCDRARILQFGDGLLLHAEHHAIRAAHANRERAFAHSLHGVLNLRAVRNEKRAKEATEEMRRQSSAGGELERRTDGFRFKNPSRVSAVSARGSSGAGGRRGRSASRVSFTRDGDGGVPGTGVRRARTP